MLIVSADSDYTVPWAISRVGSPILLVHAE